MRGQYPLPITRRLPCVMASALQRYQGSSVVRWTLALGGAVVATRWKTPLPANTKRLDSGSDNKNEETENQCKLKRRDASTAPVTPRQ